ncbi:MAG: glycerol kinase GlpK [Bacteroidales bacterium]|nr:glycerol kinase GlpK [Bacteroidales bacterium]
MNYILSVDQSTSGTKAIIFDENVRFVARSNAPHRQIYAQAGWVEHDPEEIYSNVLKVIREVIDLSGVDKNTISCISVTNQRETVLVWNKLTGKPVCNAVVWQCLRGEKKCNELKNRGLEKTIRQKTGLIIDPYFSASGLHWILNSSQEIKDKAQKGELVAGTIDSWLIWNLTGGKVHATDYTNACRTMLLNIHTLSWDKEICSLFDVPVEILPGLKHSDEVFGYTTANGFFEKEIPVTGVMGDSHAALFGQRCYHQGLSKVTYGTGSSVMMNIGAKPYEAPEGLVTSVGYSIKDKTDFVFEGNIHSTGGTIKWMVESLRLIKNSGESEDLAQSVPSTDGVYFVPAFAGLGAPYWDNTVKANISGIHGGTTKAHIVRAGLESIAYQVKDLLDLMTEKAGIQLTGIRVDGGPTRNRFLMQFQADMLNAPLTISNIEEASALGAALAGGLGIGLWKNTEKLEDLFTENTRVTPVMDTGQTEFLYEGWKNAVSMLRGTRNERQK